MLLAFFYTEYMQHLKSRRCFHKLTLKILKTILESPTHKRASLLINPFYKSLYCFGEKYFPYLLATSPNGAVAFKPIKISLPKVWPGPRHCCEVSKQNYTPLVKNQAAAKILAETNKGGELAYFLLSVQYS